MRDPPPEVIASWPPANLKNPVTRGSGLIVINSILLALVLWIVPLRCYTRLCITKSFGKDDILMILALVLVATLFFDS